MRLQTPLMLALATGLLVGACAVAPDERAQSPAAQRELAEALAGRTPGPPVRCIPNYRANQMQVIDDGTILFRDGRTVYLQKPRGECLGIATGGRTLVTRKFGTSDLCDGDINQTVDLRSGFSGGACVFGPFVPYTKPRT